MAFGSDIPSQGRVAVADLDGNNRPLVLGSTPPSPNGQVTAIALRPDGQALATGGGGTSVSLWDLADPAQPRPVGQPLGGYSGLINAATFSADGRMLVAVSEGREYRGQGIRPPDSNGRGSVILWNVADLAHPTRLGDPLTGHDGKIRAVAPSPDGRPLAVGSWDAKVYLWDVSDRSRAVTPIAAPLVGKDNVATIAFVADGSALVGAARDGPVVVWDLSRLAASRQQALTIACAATGGGLDEEDWASRVPGLAYEPTCTDADRDPLGLPSPTDVLRFGESAAVHRVVDRTTAQQLLQNTFADATSVTDTVTVDAGRVHGLVREVPAHPVRRKTSSAAVDKTTGAVYGSPRIVVRDPRVEPTPAVLPCPRST